MTELTNRLQILQYLHCDKCIKELPGDTSPQEWASLEIGWTELGLQIWCKRHNCNVMNMDFEGYKHPVDMSLPKDPKLKLVK